MGPIPAVPQGSPKARDWGWRPVGVTLNEAVRSAPSVGRPCPGGGPAPATAASSASAAAQPPRRCGLSCGPQIMRREIPSYFKRLQPPMAEGVAGRLRLAADVSASGPCYRLFPIVWRRLVGEAFWSLCPVNVLLDANHVWAAQVAAFDYSQDFQGLVW